MCGQVITCVLIAVFILVLLLICRVPNALAIAVFGGVMDVLPYVGPLLTVAPSVIAAYAVGPAVTVTVLRLLLLYEEFESRVLVPLVYGRALRLPSSSVFSRCWSAARWGDRGRPAGAPDRRGGPDAPGVAARRLSGRDGATRRMSPCGARMSWNMSSGRKRFRPKRLRRSPLKSPASARRRRTTRRTRKVGGGERNRPVPGGVKSPGTAYRE
ncbi:MAG: AI-2E family transporter [Opitutus sp.]|nr:AI-2E family transporter [Opitutus sp.]